MNDMEELDDAVPAETHQEMDAWWGAYSTWAMLPSLIICLVLTTAIVVCAWMLAERPYRQWLIWSLAGALWLVQIIRWTRRVFGWTYRLTSRRLFIERGHWRTRRWQIELRDITAVAVKRTPISAWTGVGRVIVQTGSRRWVLEGVVRPDEVVERIRRLRLSGV